MKRGLRRAPALLLCLTLWMGLLSARALTVEQARELLMENYVDVIAEGTLNQDTVEEMVRALGDPYTAYFTAEEYQSFLSTMEDQTVVGIGVTTLTNSDTADGLVIQEVLAGGAAAEAGLLAGDVIVQVDGTDVRGMASDDIIALVRGAEGSEAKITYLREETRHTVTLTRKTVTVASTTGELLDGNVGYIRCTTWGEQTPGYFEKIIGELNGKADSWLIDLRSNGGGLTDAAADTAGLFCGPELMISLRYRSTDPESPDGYAYEFYKADTKAITRKPVVILVNGNTASASEAFSAALRDYGAAVIVGERTYGKGVAQGLWDQRVLPTYFPDGDSLKITMARFYSPVGNTNDTLGVMPDFPVPPEYAEDAAWLLCEGFSRNDPASQFYFQWKGMDCSVSVDHLNRDETWAPVYAALLNAIPPDVDLRWDRDVTGRENLARFYELELEENFTDAYDSYWPEDLGTLKTYGLVNGVGDGSFQPEGTLTRAELAQMLVNALNSWIPEDGETFADVAAGAWYSDAVSAIAAQGMMEGTGEGNFSPEKTLTRQELFTVVGRLARWLNDDMDLVVRRGSEEDWNLPELEGYDDWAKPSVWLLTRAMEETDNTTLVLQPDGTTGHRQVTVNLLWDEPDAIDPTAPATREEAAEALYQLFYFLNILP